MRGLMINAAFVLSLLLEHCRMEEEIYMQIDLFSTGLITSLKVTRKAGLTPLPTTEGETIHKIFSGSPSSKIEVKVTSTTPIGVAAVIHIGTALFSTDDLTNWKDSNNQDFAYVTLSETSTQDTVPLNGTHYKLIGNRTLFANDLVFVFNIPDRPYCSNVNSKGVAPINFVRQTENIAPSLSNYVYSSPSTPTVTLQMKSTNAYGKLKSNANSEILFDAIFQLDGLDYKGTKYGKELIQYGIDQYTERCIFEIRVCFVSCDECIGSLEANKKNELCTKCAAPYAKVSDSVVGKEFNCFLRTGLFEKYYIDSQYDVFFRCNIRCLYCSLKAGQVDASCDTCDYPSYIEKENTKECYSAAEYSKQYPNYYHDSVAKRYYPCDEACATCFEPAIRSSTNCNKCGTGYFFYEGIGDNKNCILLKDNNDGFILVGDTYKLCNVACRVCKEPAKNNCEICSDTTSFITGTTICTDNSKDQILVDEKPFYKDPKDDNYYPCGALCHSCLKGEVAFNHNCEYCIDGYVFKEEEKENCFSKAEDFTGYYYEETENIYMKCFPICKECVKAGDEKINNCDTCVDGYALVKDQAGRCIMKTGILDGYYYNEKMNLFIKCYAQCVGCTNEGTLTDQKCVSCRGGLFLLKTNNNCINQESISSGKFIEDITVLLPLSGPIKPLELSSGEYKYILYPYSMQSSIDINVPYLAFTDCIEVIKTYCGINDIDELLIAQIAYNTTKVANTQTDYRFYLKNGNEIDLSRLISDKVKFNATFPLIANSTSINFDYARELESKGIDYYNPEDPFYNILCISYSKGSKDLGLVNRRNAIFPKVTLCQPGCVYEEILFANYSVKCVCSFDRTVIDTRRFGTEGESSANLILFQCYALLSEIKFDSPIVIGALCLISLKVLSTIWIILTYFRPINAKMNSIVSNPPKKSKAEEEVNSNSDAEENEAESPKIILEKKPTLIKVNSLKSNDGDSFHQRTSLSQTPIEEMPVEKEEDKKDEVVQSPVEVQDLLKIKGIQIKSTLKTKEELFEKDMSEKEIKKNVEQFDQEFIKANDFKMSALDKNATIEVETLNGKKEAGKEGIDLIEEDSKKAPNKKRSISCYIEEGDNSKIDINEKPNKKKGKGKDKGENILTSNIDLGFDNQGTKLSPDEANVASFNEIEYECDSRRYWRFFFDIYSEKQMLLSLFKFNNLFFPLSFRVLMLLFNISSIVFFNALLYTPSYLTKRLEATEEIDFVFLIVEEYDKALYASLCAFAVGKIYYLIYYSNVLFLRLYDKGRKNAEKLLSMIRVHKVKLVAFIVFLYAVMGLFYFFIPLFCILYPNNVSGLIYASLMSFVFNFLIHFVTCTVISFTRFIGIDNHLK